MKIQTKKFEKFMKRNPGKVVALTSTLVLLPLIVAGMAELASSKQVEKFIRRSKGKFRKLFAAHKAGTEILTDAAGKLEAA